MHGRRDAVIAATDRRRVRNIRVFGSVARAEDGPLIDVDLLVDIDDGVSFFDLLGLVRELEEMLGVDVDVARADSLKTEMRSRVVAEAISS